MTTFGYSEMRDWAEQSDDPRVRSMWERLSNCRSKIAKWCQAAEYAELRTKNLAAENAALRAEVERLQERFDAVRDAAHAEAKRVFPETVVESHFGGELHADDLCSMLATEIERLREECSFWRDRLRIASAKMDGQHTWRLSSSDWPPLIGPDADAVVRNALKWLSVQPLPAPPDAG